MATQGALIIDLAERRRLREAAATVPGPAAQNASLRSVAWVRVWFVPVMRVQVPTSR